MDDDRQGRRSNGEGSYTRKPNGTWMARIQIAGRRRVVVAATRAECQVKLRALLHKSDAGEPIITNKLTLGAYLREWIGGPTKLRVRTSTWEGYEKNARNHLIPKLGKIRLKDLTYRHIDMFIADLLAEGLTPATVHRCTTLLHTALAEAMKRGLVAHNAEEMATKPRELKRELTTLTLEETARFIEVATSDPNGALWVTLLDTGMRLGEALGLRWTDVDLDNARVHIEQTLESTSGPASFGRTKSDKARDVSLAPFTVRRLREHRAAQLRDELAAKRWTKTGLVFCSDCGTPRTHSNAYRAFQAFLLRAGIERHLYPHALRHSSASLLLAAGMDLPTVSKRLGHAQVSTTANIYAHVNREQEDRAAAFMQRVLTGTDGHA